MEGWYYLHTNGDLIYKRELGSTAADIRESPFAKAMWPFDPTDRLLAWRTVVEAAVFGAQRQRIDELKNKWKLTDEDAQIYARHADFDLLRDGDQWCARRHDFLNLQESPAGFGNTAFDAIVELAKALELRPTKMWGATFHDLVKQEP